MPANTTRYLGPSAFWLPIFLGPSCLLTGDNIGSERDGWRLILDENED